MHAHSGIATIPRMVETNHNILVQRACRQIESGEHTPGLASLARAAGMSPWHFQRVFKSRVGVSPKQYAMAQRKRRLDAGLRRAASVTDAIYAAGYAASSAAYRDSQSLGMRPQVLRRGGANERIQYAGATTSLGKILVAATARGICMVEFGTERELAAELQRRFPRADIEKAPATMSESMARVIAVIDANTPDPSLPLDIRGTAFQVKVWNALTKLKQGQTISYGDLARRIRAPTSTRAVARACASNGIAVLVPCHRVISSSGELTGYKWGIARKRKLLERERRAVTPVRTTP
jgi:AraC family transcriptional regulator of adaptative response/methylated-DNA-[protein]-cysteine methyltransferase